MLCVVVVCVVVVLFCFCHLPALRGPMLQVVLEASVTLRVRFPDGRFLTMRFNTAHSVQDVKAQIFTRFAPDAPAASVTMQQFALFQPAGTFTQPRWLQDDRLLSFYDLVIDNYVS